MGDTMVEDGRPSGTRSLGKTAPVVGAGALIGLAVEFHWLGWSSIPGNSCGGRYRPCPEGTTPTLILAFLFTFAGAVALIVALAAFRSSRPGRAVPGALVAAGVLIALWPGWQAYLWMRGPVLDPAWQAGQDRPASVRGVGAWTVGEDGATVVRARTDALVAYDSGSGDRGWVLRAPVRESVCAMSERIVDGVGLVAFARDEKPCDTVWGVDVRSGRKVWERNISGRTVAYGQGGGGLLTAGAGVAVVSAEHAVHGYGLADGAVRWTAELVPAAGTEGEDDVACEPVAASAASATTTVAVTCGSYEGFHSAYLLTLATATGKELSRRDLPIESYPSSAAVLSAEPFTLLVREKDERGLAAVLSYGDPGDPKREPVTIPLTADEEDLAVDASDPAFAARPVFRAVVADGSLIVAAAKPENDYPEQVSAYSLDDGRRLWHTDLGTPVEALAPAGPDRVAVLGESQRLWTLTTGDGTRVGEEDGTTVRDISSKLDSGPQLVRAGDGWVIVNADGDSRPPALAIAP
ncbi:MULTISPECIES: PQQ-binding-like beta-propeller repeat protein [Streptomyces]|uniref:PQQ-binding-like beta-propeller repeat protein n=1 Tax=Streptomyces edwardsiae TaxID=3075527 RepID=A0ABU2PNT6_9ACTN|nr:PQQ-binding-like beta-propeller repeat protein [Streptomyces sp. DSM 41636]MDT0393819.1 PQQ-binding-like beta-propeller repeat protein [Streptomyces sp. DSM 41636]